MPTLNNISDNTKSLLLEMRTVSKKFTIAAANPLLAEKLASPSVQIQQQHSPMTQTYNNSCRQQPDLALLGVKIEAGRWHYFIFIHNLIEKRFSWYRFFEIRNSEL